MTSKDFKLDLFADVGLRHEDFYAGADGGLPRATLHP